MLADILFQITCCIAVTITNHCFFQCISSIVLSHYIHLYSHASACKIGHCADVASLEQSASKSSKASRIFFKSWIRPLMSSSFFSARCLISLQVDCGSPCRIRSSLISFNEKPSSFARRIKRRRCIVFSGYCRYPAALRGGDSINSCHS